MLHVAVLSLALSASGAFDLGSDGGSQSGDVAPVSLNTLLAELARTDTRVAGIQEDVTVISVKDELNSKGEVKSSLEKVLRLQHGPPGTSPKTILVRATEDGEDVTAKAREELREEEEKKAKDAKEGDTLSSSNPFSVANQSKYRFSLMAPPAASTGLVRIRFAAIDAADKLFNGDAVVDPRTNQLVTVTAVPAKLPRFVHRAKFWVEFANAEGNPRLTSIRAEGEGGFLFFKKRFRVAVRFTDYAKPKE